MKLLCVSTGSHEGNCYLLKSDDGRYVILDCGVKYSAIEKACDYQVDNIDFALCTHVHKDHTAGIEQLIRYGVDVYTNHEVRDKYHGCKWIGRNSKVKISGWAVTAFVVPHTHNDGEKCLNYAYMIEKDGTRLLYMTDWMYCFYNLHKFDIHHFLIAINYTELEEDAVGNIKHVLRGHSSLKTAKDFLTTSMNENCKTIVACHLSSRNADAEQILRELMEIAPNAHIAIMQKGLEINL